MSTDLTEGYDAIAEHYGFFERYATEVSQDAVLYRDHLTGFDDCDGPIEMLDFGCGSGTFAVALLEQTRWAPERLRLTVVDPGERHRAAAVARLRQFTASPIGSFAALPDGLDGRVDLAITHHVLYHVPDLDASVRGLLAALKPGGTLLISAISGHNVLLQPLRMALETPGHRLAYNTLEDVAALLGALEVAHEPIRAPYRVRFPDSPENRRSLLGFLLAELPAAISDPHVLEWFDQFSDGTTIDIPTHSDGFKVTAPGAAGPG